jgi:hypothetical protein
MYPTETLAVQVCNSSQAPNNKYEDINYAELETRYQSVESYIQKIAIGEMRSLIVNGPAGVGKTHSVESYLKKYCSGRYKVVTGHMTPLALYFNLYFHREENQILVLDDIDSVFKKIEAVNLLKAAMDTSPVRRISYESSTSKLTIGNVPASHEFKGGIILISNIGFENTQKSALGAHLDALKDRSYNLTISDRSKESCFKQVCFMVIKKQMLKEKKLTPSQVYSLLEYIEKNLEVLNKVSLRTATKLADLIKVCPENWIDMANSGLLKELN